MTLTRLITLRPRFFSACAVLVLCAITGTADVAYAAGAVESSDSVPLKPGDDLQRVVDSHPPGTTFLLAAGVYRLQSVRPKEGDSFVGARGAILNGARVLTRFRREGRYWVAAGQNQQGQLNGACDPEHPRCMHPEDLFFDNHPLRHVAELSSVGPGTWFFDYPNHKIYFADDPSGHTVETSVARSAFAGPAGHVTIRGLIVEKYAIPAQFGAIGDQYPGPNWVVEHNEVRWNHGTGISLVDGSKALENFVHDNGQKGIGGVGQNILMQGNEVSSNNWAGFALSWEAGGAKFALSKHLTVRGNSIHDNIGEGLWCDIDCLNNLYENNAVVNNTGGGIAYEISYGAVIRNNVVRGNGLPNATWLWEAQILVQNSRDVEIYGNTVDVAPDRGNGIGIIQQNRGSGALGPHIAANNYVHHNVIIHRRSPQGADGEVADYNQKELANQNNRFDYNAYHVTDTAAPHWIWGTPQNWEGLRRLGQEAHGTIDTSLPPAR